MVDPTTSIATKVGIGVATKALTNSVTLLSDGATVAFKKALARWKNDKAVKALANKVLSAQKVKTFWHRDKAVPLWRFYYPTKLLIHSQDSNSLKSLADLPKDENLVIEGTVGQGKSIFLRYLSVKELSQMGSGRIPILIELRSIGERSLLAAVYEALERLDFEIDDELFQLYAKSGRFVLLLDAFDEVPETRAQRMFSELEGLSEKYESLQIIVTSRPQSSIQLSRFFTVVRLAPLERNDHKGFLLRIGVKHQDADRLDQALQSSSVNVAKLLTTPLMLTLLAMLYDLDRIIPAEVPEFYEALFQTLLTRHDALKPGLSRQRKSGLSERRLRELFESFCFSTLKKYSSARLTAKQFHQALSNAKRYARITCDEEAFKHDVIKVACLILEDGFEYSFVHKSVAEFYAASFISEATPEQAIAFYSKVADIEASRARSVWAAVLTFLNHIDNHQYLRYYLVPLLTSFLTKLGILLCEVEKAGEIDGRQIANTLFADFRVELERDDKGKISLASVSDCAMDLSLTPQGAHAVITAVVDEATPMKYTTPDEIGPEFSVLWSDFVGPEGVEFVAAACRKDVLRLLEARRDAIRRLEIDKKRSDFFDI